MNPTLEMRRLAGKFTLLVVFVYLLALFGMTVAVITGQGPHWLAWLLLPLPAVAFVPAAVAAVRLHRTQDPMETSRLWRRCVLLAAIGAALLAPAAVTAGRLG